MKKKRFSVEQIVATLKQIELGMTVTAASRQLGVSEQAIYRWKVVYGGLHYATSRRRACRVVCQHRSVHYYRSRKDPKTALRLRMRELAQVRIRYGCRRLHVLLLREGWSLGKNLTYRLCTEESLQLRSEPPRRRKVAVARRERYVPKRPNQAWSMEFVADQVVNGTRFRALAIVDVYTREALDIVLGQRLRAEQVVEACTRLVATRGSPVRIFVDNVLSVQSSSIPDDGAPTHSDALRGCVQMG